MIKANKVLMADARHSLSGNWGVAVLFSFMYFLISGILQVIPILGPLALFLIYGPLSLGIAIFALNMSNERDYNVSNLFDGFNNFGNALGAYFLMTIFILLWTMLFIIPGLIAMLAYSQTYFIMAENPRMNAYDAIKLSRKMMSGNKTKFFFLSLRFIGWLILCLLTFGIGFLWLFPYMEVSFANFYKDVKEDYESKHGPIGMRNHYV